MDRSSHKVANGVRNSSTGRCTAWMLDFPQSKVKLRRNGNTSFLLVLKTRQFSRNCHQELYLEAALWEDIAHPGVSNARKYRPQFRKKNPGNFQSWSPPRDPSGFFACGGKYPFASVGKCCRSTDRR